MDQIPDVPRIEFRPTKVRFNTHLTKTIFMVCKEGEPNSIVGLLPRNYYGPNIDYGNAFVFYNEKWYQLSSTAYSTAGTGIRYYEACFVSYNNKEYLDANLEKYLNNIGKD